MDTEINAFCSCTDLVSSTLVHIGNNKYAISSTSSNNAVDAEHSMYAFNHEMESIVRMVGLIEPGETAEIGIFAGSGNYDPKLIKEPKELKVYTPYGATSDNVIVGYVGEKKVAFLVRHQRGHRIPPHKINFRANIWAMKALGVTRIISPAAVGSLQPERIKPSEFVVCDQIVSFTAAPRMNQTFFDGGVVGHVAFADPFCPELRKVIADTAVKLGMKIHAKEASKDHDSFEYVCIEGPRFSTRAESLFYKRQGWDVVGKAKNR